jgi:A/G-specific adenine glycosylase
MNKEFGKILIKWYRQNHRNLPWRQTKNPYHIWLSEIILQQTQVAQGLAYYEKFIKSFPSVNDLAEAHQDEVLKLWQGLGYYSRARNLHHTAKEIISKHKGKFPASYNELLKLKGVGNYTAAAIASFAYNLPHAVVDGNVYRVLSRWFDIETPIDSPKAKRDFQNLADELLLTEQAAEYNQAIMEFGSQWCKPVNPKCGECPFQINCQAFLKHTVSDRPVKGKKTKISERHFNYFVIIDKTKNAYVQQRVKKDIWEGLFEFFLIETEKKTELNALINNKELKKITGAKPLVDKKAYHFKHILSHQHIHATFHVIKSSKAIIGKNKMEIVNLHTLAWSRLTDKFLNSCNLYE